MRSTLILDSAFISKGRRMMANDMTTDAVKVIAVGLTSMMADIPKHRTRTGRPRALSASGAALADVRELQPELDKLRKSVMGTWRKADQRGTIDPSTLWLMNQSLCAP